MKQEENQNIVYLLKLLIIIFIIIAAMIVIFATGVWVGQERAQFSFAWAENYHNNFGGPKKGMLKNFPMSDYTNSHGVFGTVLSVDETSLVVAGDDSKEKTIVVNANTNLVDSKGKIMLPAIDAGDTVVVIGSPNNQGQIKAEFIRVLPQEK